MNVCTFMVKNLMYKKRLRYAGIAILVLFSKITIVTVTTVKCLKRRKSKRLLLHILITWRYERLVLK